MLLAVVTQKVHCIQCVPILSDVIFLQVCTSTYLCTKLGRLLFSWLNGWKVWQVGVASQIMARKFHKQIEILNLHTPFDICLLANFVAFTDQAIAKTWKKLEILGSLEAAGHTSSFARTWTLKELVTFSEDLKILASFHKFGICMNKDKKKCKHLVCWILLITLLRNCNTIYELHYPNHTETVSGDESPDFIHKYFYIFTWEAFEIEPPPPLKAPCKRGYYIC